jgi:hypothetical protein
LGALRLPHLRWLLCALWIAILFLAFTFTDATSIRNWLYLAVGMVIPPAVMMTIWNDGPPQTVAELLRSTEERR